MKRFVILTALWMLSLGLVIADDAKTPAEMKKDDEKKTEEKPAKAAEPKLGDFKDFADMPGEWAGEVIKCDETSVTVRQQRRVKSGNSYKTENNDVEFKYADGALARKEKAPKFFNNKGLERPATAGELEKLKKPAGVPGFAIDKADLKNGDLVKLKLVRPRTISASKVKPEECSIKYAVMVGEAAKPSAPAKK